MNDERYWNINLLNKWFAISSLIFMATFIWMFIDDNDDEFKKYQRAFRKMEVKLAEEELLIEIEKVQDERITFDDKLLDAENFIITDYNYGNAKVLESKTTTNLRKLINYVGPKSDQN